MSVSREDVLAHVRDYPEDVQRMVACLHASGMQANPLNVAWAWANHSDDMCASWLSLPLPDDVLVSVLREQLPRVPVSFSDSALLARSGGQVADDEIGLPDAIRQAAGWAVGDSVEISIDDNLNLVLRRVGIGP